LTRSLRGFATAVERPNAALYYFEEKAALSPDGERVVTAPYNGGATLWDVATGKKVSQLFPRSMFVDFIFFGVGADKASVAIAAHPSRGRLTISILDAESGKKVRVLTGHDDHVDRDAGAVTPDGRYLASGSSDDTVRVWDVEAGRAIAVFRNRGGRPRAVALDARGDS
jgi:WD40 repeat protein